MWVLGWRFVVLAAYAFWQGGFIFYTSEVVPIGTEVLGSSAQQGYITRHVTRVMNWAGVAALAVFGIDLWVSRSPVAGLRKTRLLAWVAMAGLLGVLIYVHPRLDALLDPDEPGVLDYKAFYPLHRLYLWVSAVQWFFGIAYLALTLWAWRQRDTRVLSEN